MKIKTSVDVYLDVSETEIDQKLFDDINRYIKFITSLNVSYDEQQFIQKIENFKVRKIVKG